MDTRQLLLKALSVLTHITEGHKPRLEDTEILKQHAVPDELQLSTEALARAIIRRTVVGAAKEVRKR